MKNKPLYALARDTFFSGKGHYEGMVSMFAIEAKTRPEATRARDALLARGEMEDVRIVSRLPRETSRLAVRVVEHDSAKASGWFKPLDKEQRDAYRMFVPLRKLRKLRDGILAMGEYVGDEQASAMARRFIVAVPLRDAKGYRTDCRDGLMSEMGSEPEGQKRVNDILRSGVPGVILRVDDLVDSQGYDGDLVVLQKGRRGRIETTYTCDSVIFVHLHDVDVSRAVAIDDNMEVFAPTLAAQMLRNIALGEPARGIPHGKGASFPYFETGRR